jgi:hypothetical protein
VSLFDDILWAEWSEYSINRKVIRAVFYFSTPIPNLHEKIMPLIPELDPNGVRVGRLIESLKVIHSDFLSIQQLKGFAKRSICSGVSE